MKLKIRLFAWLFIIAFAVQAQAADTSDWFAYEIPDADKLEGTALDASYLLDAPAGKHGFLNRTEEDNFVFEDGTNMRFWGICLSDEDAIPEYEDSVLLAKRFSQLGYNLVRFISIENEIFSGRKIEGGREINEENMDKLCFLLSELKKRGIYYIFDLNSGYFYSSDDNITDAENIPRSFGIYGYFDGNMINLQKKMIGRLFGYYNPYTAMRLADDPAMVFMNLRNETSLITAIESDMTSDYYNAQLREKFNTYLKEKYQTNENVKNAWTHKYPYNTKLAVLLEADESIDSLSVKLPPLNIRRNDDLGRGVVYSKLRQEESNSFLSDIHINYFNDMTQYLRNDLGIKCLISGCTAYDKQWLTLLNYYSDKNMDLIETHLYNGHIDGSKCILYVDSSTGKQSVSKGLLEKPASLLGKKNNTAGSSDTVTDNGYAYLGQNMSRNVLGKPHVISEWNYAALSPYKSEGLLLMSAYGSMQNASMVMYDWGSNKVSSYSSEDMFINEQYSTYNQPNYISALPAASAIFIRQDAEKAQKGFYYERYRGSEPFTREFQRELPSEYDELETLKTLRTLSNQTVLIGKTGMTFDDIQAYDDSKNSNDVLYLAKKFSKEGKFTSITGDMSYDTNQRIYKLNTARAQAAAGFISDMEIELDDVIFDIDNDFATVYLTSVGNDDIYKSERVLLSTVGHQLNTNQEMDETEQFIVDSKAGNGPILIEPVTGRITLKTKNEISVYALDNSGQRTQELSVAATDGKKSFDLIKTAVNYEIVQKADSPQKNEHIALGDLTVEDLFTDVSAKDKTAVERACLLGIMDAKTETEFKPGEPVSRQEFIGAVTDALNIYVYTNGSGYGDVDSTNKYYKQISVAKKLGLLSVYDSDGLNPAESVSRDEMISILGNATLASGRGSGLAQKYGVSLYSSDELEKVLTGEGYIDSSTAEKGFVTRAETAGIIYNIMWK